MKAIFIYNSIKLMTVAFLLFVSSWAAAYDYTYWDMGNFHSPNFQNPSAGCDYLYSKFYWGSTPGGLGDYYLPSNNYYSSATQFECGNSLVSGGHLGEANLKSVQCSDSSTFDFIGLNCLQNGSRGQPNNRLSCAKPNKEVGDPVNLTNGYLFEIESDIAAVKNNPLALSRTFNGLDGFWVHNYSAHLIDSGNVVALIKSDRSSFNFIKYGDSYLSAIDGGMIVSTDAGYEYTDKSNSKMYFDLTGNLKGIKNNGFPEITISRSDQAPNYKLLIRSVGSADITIIENARHEILAASSVNVSLSYNYDSDYGRLASVTRTVGGIQSNRTYHYDSPSWQYSLTGITDERGVRYVTWTYDYSQRVVKTALANGAGSVLISYPYSDQTVVTNSLGRKTTYSLENVQGQNEITSIKGEPSVGCPASNSSYTYNDNGQVLSKTDAKGYITTYTYNDRGLEASRTEASGTPQARTTTTTWDPTRFLRTQVVEPDRTTVYSYDDQGRLINTQVNAR